ncbi:proline racemase [Desulfocicer vacuolatum DSM 3385]|uniref:Proline racemase n=1 Tax=Desulfocicer vacuolatum DSM 3385 TaxID=1121400 RepID=A0A1W2DYA6_9BACT|nr:proline racemase family protein [Desulfocicer vacuolatum]SMD02511.1 proline racemase [Desulfocicer vacuolatum DSM 3385]
MNIKKTVTTVDAHTAGEATRIVTGGIPHVPGKTMGDKKKWIEQHLDDLRKMLMWEPRGHQDMFGAILTAPASEDAHTGVVFMDSGGYLDMCGHGSMGAAAVLVDTGMVSLDDLENGMEKKIFLDTPAGKITARVEIEDGGADAVTIQNVPAFYYDTVEIPLAGLGSIRVDISYGGNFFALVNVEQLKMTLALPCLDQLKSLGLEIRDRVNETVSIVHPGTGKPARVDLTEIYQDGDPVKNMVIFGNGQVDRSPCGTGTCAKMAWLHEMGRLAVGERYDHASMLNTLFTGKIVSKTSVGGRTAIVPEISGSAHITGFHQFVAEKKDPFKTGFLLKA